MDFDPSSAESVAVAEPVFDAATAAPIETKASPEFDPASAQSIDARQALEDVGGLPKHREARAPGFIAETKAHDTSVLPELPSTEGTTLDPFQEGIGRAGYEAVRSLTTPQNIGIALATGGLSELAQGGSALAKLALKGIGLGFGAEMASELPEKSRKAVAILQDPNASVAEKTQAVADPAITASLSFLATKSAFGEHGAETKTGTETDVSPQTKAREELNAQLAGQTVKIQAQRPDGSTVDLEVPASHVAELYKQTEEPAAAPVKAPKGEATFDPSSAESIAAQEPFVAETAKALGTPAPEVQYTVFPSEVHPETGGKIPGYAQVETKTNEGRGEPLTDEQRAQYPSEAEVLATDLPKGQYTLEQVQEAIKAKAEAPPYNDFGSPESDTHGVANRVNEARAKSGDIAPVETGTSPGPEALIAKGREMLKEGETPDEAFTRAQTIPDAGDRLGFVRAYGEKLFKEASAAADKFGTDSPEYAAAAKLDSDWASRIQPLKTDLARGFHALQGETEIDTGTFHGIRRAFNELSGREFTPTEEVTAKKFVSDQKAATKAVEEIAPEFKKAIESVVAPARKSVSGKILSNLRERSDAAMARLKAKQGRVSAGLDPTDFKDYVEIAAYHLARGIDAGAELLKQFGEKIREHIPGILDAAKKTYADATKGELGNTVAGVYQRAKDYLDAGETNPSDVVAKIAADLGTTQADVWEKLATNKTVRNVTDETFKRMAERRALTDAARNWVKDRSAPLAYRVATAPFRAGFRTATFGHGTVAPFTHAPTLGFNPATFSIFWRNWAKGFKLMGLRDAGAYHERVMQDLVRDPNYITARRAGLANDPHRAVTDYEKAWMGGWFEKVGAIGNRGFDSLKLIRQEYFNQLWDKTPDSLRTPLMAQLFADDVNHATGTVKRSYGPVTRAVFFAPKLIASQFAHLVGDSAKAAAAIAKGSKASPEERAAAINHVKFLATAVGAYVSALALNQGLLSASGSKQKINFTDFHKADWFKFKALGLNIAPVSGPLAMVRLLGNLLRIEFGELEGKEKRGGKGAALLSTSKDFVRSKFSPTMGVAVDVATGTDYAERPLPFSKEKVPAYLRREGVGKYTYAEYATTHMTPIPVAEAAREVWKQQGMDESTIEHWIEAILMGVEAGAVGARVTPDYNEKKGK